MTLTEFSYYSRKFLPFIVIFSLLFLILVYFVQISLKLLGSPRKALVYTNPVFGKIKKPVIKEASPSSNIDFTLDTIEGQPETATASANIYFLPPSTARFGYREKIYLMAKTLGFDTELIKHKLEGNEAVFKDSKQTFTVDITNFNFTYEYNFVQDESLFETAQAPVESEIENKATEFLKSVGRYPPQLAQGKTNTIFILYQPQYQRILLVKDSKEANIAEVDFYRPDIDQFTIVSPRFFNSPNYVMLVKTVAGFKIIKAQVKFFERSESQYGTYLLKTGETAWKQLKKGQGLVVSNPEGLKSVIIKKMFVGYLDPDFYQNYLQPVYVFLGEKNFVAYVPAVSDEFLLD